MVRKLGELLLIAVTPIFCACSSDTDGSLSPERFVVPQGQEETAESLLHLKASPSDECPPISGFYRCVENCRERVGDPRLLELVESEYGHHFRDDREIEDFKSFLELTYLRDGKGYIVDGLIHDKSEAVQTSLSELSNNLESLNGDVIRKTLSSLGIDADQEIEKLDFNRFEAGYQAACSDDQLTIHHVMDDFAEKIKIQSIAENVLSVQVFRLVDGHVSADESRFEWIAAIEEPEENRDLGPPAVDLQSAAAVQRESIIGTWLEQKVPMIQLENRGVINARNKQFLNMTFSKPKVAKNEFEYKMDKWSFWGRKRVNVEEASRYDGFEIQTPPYSMGVFVDLSTKKVIYRRHIDQEIGYIYESDGEVFINLDLDCGGILIRGCAIRVLEN